MANFFRIFIFYFLVSLCSHEVREQNDVRHQSIQAGAGVQFGFLLFCISSSQDVQSCKMHAKPKQDSCSKARPTSSLAPPTPSLTSESATDSLSSNSTTPDVQDDHDPSQSVKR
ncbi:hypothetical protein HDK90DRAFT_485581 [Phyllosticta capitalensis]|uniref:Uncharacterized protein n=1 Tax=Phyllosticta capitalensis TaxID=121624 RepID=A0ABR1YQJ8_9PEZI